MGIERSFFTLVRSAIQNEDNTQVFEARISYRETYRPNGHLQVHPGDISSGGNHFGEPVQVFCEEQFPVSEKRNKVSHFGFQKNSLYQEALEQLSKQNSRNQNAEFTDISGLFENGDKPKPDALEVRRRAYYNRYLAEYYAPKGEWLDFKV